MIDNRHLVSDLHTLPTQSQSLRALYLYSIPCFSLFGVGNTDSQAFYASLLDILDDKALTVIFANIEDLLLTATSFLSELEERQKACRLYIDVIGDILEEHMRKMRVYMVSQPSCLFERVLSRVRYLAKGWLAEHMT